MGMVHYNRQKSREKLLRGEMPTWIANSPRRDYIARVVLSVPPWVRQCDLLVMQQEAARMSKAYGREYHLDHIVPLAHPKVCGLTVPWNLCIRRWDANLSKSNYWVSDWDGEQLDLFMEPEPEDTGLVLI